MANSTRVKSPSFIGGKKRTRTVIFAGCDACGQVHAVAFEGLHDFVTLTCPVELVPIYRTPTAAKEVFKRVQRDLLAGAVAA